MVYTRQQYMRDLVTVNKYAKGNLKDYGNEEKKTGEKWLGIFSPRATALILYETATLALIGAGVYEFGLSVESDWAGVSMGAMGIPLAALYLASAKKSSIFAPSYEDALKAAHRLDANKNSLEGVTDSNFAQTYDYTGMVQQSRQINHANQWGTVGTINGALLGAEAWMYLKGLPSIEWDVSLLSYGLGLAGSAGLLAWFGDGLFTGASRVLLGIKKDNVRILKTDQDSLEGLIDNEKRIDSRAK